MISQSRSVWQIEVHFLILAIWLVHFLMCYLSSISVLYMLHTVWCTVIWSNKWLFCLFFKMKLFLTFRETGPSPKVFVLPRDSVIELRDFLPFKSAFWFICISKAFGSSVSNFRLFQDDRRVNKKHRLQQIKKVAERENRKYIYEGAVKNARKINKTDTLFHCQWHSRVIWSTYLCTVSRTIPVSRND